jgi:hypothetical protein
VVEEAVESLGASCPSAQLTTQDDQPVRRTG